MADTLILYKNKTNTYQFTVVTEGIALSEATISLCIQVADKITVVFKCTPALDNNYICEVTDTSFLKNGIFKGWLEVVTSNGLIFKPFNAEVEVKNDTTTSDTKVTADIKKSSSSAPVVVKKEEPVKTSDNTEVKKDDVKKEEIKKDDSKKEEPKKEESKKEESKKEETKKDDSDADKKKEESANTDAKVLQILQGMGLSTKRSVNESLTDRSKIPSIKSKYKQH